ncbi:uncharacterized [Tachysurus ichikawai]
MLRVWDGTLSMNRHRVDSGIKASEYVGLGSLSLVISEASIEVRKLHSCGRSQCGGTESPVQSDAAQTESKPSFLCIRKKFKPRKHCTALYNRV